jgi:hypothetical protein
MWCIQEITPEYRERMYNLLDLYAEPYDPLRPVICMDEKSKQLLANVRTSLPMKTGRPERQDYEYKRHGTRNIFVAVEPKGGRRIVAVTRRRTRKDFARFIKYILDAYPHAERIRLVLDNLNTHFAKSFTETFPETHEEILRRIEFHYTPKHASWLNMAELEITPLRPAFARAPACGSADIVPLAPHKSCPAVAHLLADGRPDASTVPTSPRYPSSNLRATATVVGVVAWS